VFEARVPIVDAIRYVTRIYRTGNGGVVVPTKRSGAAAVMREP
jgi:hypothetical protein